MATAIVKHKINRHGMSFDDALSGMRNSLEHWRGKGYELTSEISTVEKMWRGNWRFVATATVSGREDV